MTRLYIQPSWIDSCSDHGEWSGGNDQYRGDKSIEAVPTYINGRPNINAFSDAAIEARREKKKTSVPLVDRVLPQQRRVRVLTEQLYELEAERKSGMDIHTYTQLRDILIVKRDRAQVLLDRASKVKPVREEYPEDSYQDSALSYTETFDSSSDNTQEGGEDTEPCGVSFIDELSNGNSLKKILQTTCKAVRKLIHFSHKAKAYWQELKEV